ncbi:MAG: hypothetical protein WD039_08665 [Xanthobacteraceae bacterium]
MSSIRRLVEELKRMRAKDQALLDQLNCNAPDGVDLDARRQSLAELNLAARVDEGVIEQLERLAERESTGVQRLGQVLFWTGNIIAALIIAIAAFNLNLNETTAWLFVGGAALTFYLFGRACRYVLSGY